MVSAHLPELAANLTPPGAGHTRRAALQREEEARKGRTALALNVAALWSARGGLYDGEAVNIASRGIFVRLLPPFRDFSPECLLPDRHLVWSGSAIVRALRPAGARSLGQSNARRRYWSRPSDPNHW
jgi:hypothetical protein